MILLACAGPTNRVKCRIADYRGSLSLKAEKAVLQQGGYFRFDRSAGVMPQPSGLRRDRCGAWAGELFDGSS
jgi:hypothetical protein